MRCWSRLILLALCAAIMFGGTFTCKAESDIDEFTENPRTPAR